MLKQKEKLLSGSLLIGLAYMIFTQSFWPHILIALGVYFCLQNIFNSYYLRAATVFVIYSSIYLYLAHPFLITFETLLAVILCVWGLEKILKAFFQAKQSAD
ncbi:MAG: hypothetical protein S4CHLAM7_02550 [Chlamydiae bacterium]|nr:hypothetical protein [Chlamydiota bacterium]